MIEKIVEMIEKRGLKQNQVERSCHLSENRISKWKDGQGEPKARELLRIADVLGVPMRWLADDAMDTPQPELSEVQARILWLAEQIGYDLAVKRLAAANETTPAPREGEPGLINATVRKDLRGVEIPEIKRKDRAPDGDPEPSGSGKGKPSKR